MRLNGFAGLRRWIVLGLVALFGVLILGPLPAFATNCQNRPYGTFFFDGARLLDASQYNGRINGSRAKIDVGQISLCAAAGPDYSTTVSAWSGIW